MKSLEIRHNNIKNPFTSYFDIANPSYKIKTNSEKMAIFQFLNGFSLSLHLISHVNNFNSFSFINDRDYSFVLM